MQRLSSYGDVLDFLKRNPDFFHVAYFNETDPVSMAEEFERVAQAVHACRDMVFVVEEVDLYTNPHFLPFAFERLISVGRHRDIALFVTSRRPASVHPLIRSQANQIVTFRQIEPRDLKWLAEVMGEEAAEKVRTLPRFVPFRWRDDGTVIDFHGTMESEEDTAAADGKEPYTEEDEEAS